MSDDLWSELGKLIGSTQTTIDAARKEAERVAAEAGRGIAGALDQMQQTVTRFRCGRALGPAPPARAAGSCAGGGATTTRLDLVLGTWCQALTLRR